LSLLFLRRQKFIKSCLGLSQPFILRISVLFDLVRWPCCFFRTVEALARGHYHGEVWLSPWVGRYSSNGLLQGPYNTLANGLANGFPKKEREQLGKTKGSGTAIFCIFK
jgi:hypothetical protein